VTDLDLDELARRLPDVTDVAPLAGGASSLTFRGVFGGRPVAVKVAPPGHPPVAHRDVLRQARIMRALAGTEVPVPEVLTEDDGDPPLFVMSMVDGETFEPLFDPPAGPVNRAVAQRYRNAARTMADLHRLAPADLGLADEPVVDAAAEVDRWCATLETVDAALVPGWHDVRDALRTTVPPAMGPRVVHGDFRLGNLLAVDARIAAVIDWEIWSLGDPRVDLGWFLVNAEPSTYSRPSPYVDAAPTRADLLSYYGEVPDVEWFMALACFKSTATWALIVKHNRRRTTPRTDLEGMAPVLPALLQRATALLG
jgi:aminoglycoside phosphotransferase (APT) family kinase protein